MTHVIPFLCHVTSNKTYDFCMFSKFVNVVPIDLKIGTHIDWTYTMYFAKTCINKSNVTYVSMTTKYPIIKHRAFQNIFLISTNNEDLSLILLQHTYGHIYKMNDLERSTFKVKPLIHWFSRVRIYLLKLSHKNVH